MDPARFTGRHIYPGLPTWVQLVAYERRAGGWELFAFEPPGVCPPEWEEERVDPHHIRLGELASAEQIDDAVPLVHAQLGPEYEPVLAYREASPDERTGVNRRLHYLHKAGATGYAARRGADGHYELWARRKDLALLQQLVK